MVKSKKAIAMIELIFALVIMGIVLMSAPMLIQQSIKSGNVALQQEAIAAAAAQASVVLSMHWDEANANVPIGESPILDTNRTDLDFSSTTKPLGLEGVDSRNFTDLNNTVLVPSTIGVDGEGNFTAYDDVDDFNGQSFGVTVFNSEVTTADVGDYVDVDININTNVNYADDSLSSFNKNLIDTNIADINNISLGVISNIKFIKVNLTSNSGVDELDKNITLNAFSCNIGTSLPKGDKEL